MCCSVSLSLMTYVLIPFVGFFLMSKDLVRMLDSLFPACAFDVVFVLLEISSRTLFPLFRPHGGPLCSLEKICLKQRLTSSCIFTCMLKIFCQDQNLTVPTRSGELWMQKLKSHLVRTQYWNVLPLKLGVGQYIAIHATLTARDFFLAYFYRSGPFTCTFSKTSPDFSCVGCGYHMVPV